MRHFLPGSFRIAPGRAVAAALGAAACLYAGLATAQSEAVLTLRGSISPSCSITLGGSGDGLVNGMILEESGTVRHPVEVECNTPFTGTIRSENGGLVNFSSEEAGFSGGVSRIPYDLTLRLPGLDPVGPIQSEDLVSPKAFDSGPDVLFTTTGEVELNWDGERRAYAGEFTDKVYLSVTSRR